MKPSLPVKDNKRKLFHYEQYRNTAKTEFKCNSSSLLPDLNDLDVQVKHFQQLRKKKLSVSQVQSLNFKDISNLEQVHAQKSHRLFTNNLQTIQEYQAVRQAGRSKTNNLSSFGVPIKNQKPAEKNIIPKNINGKAKQQAKRQKIQALKAKTKQLHKDFLVMAGYDLTKKSLINKQFSLLLKLLE